MQGIIILGGKGTRLNLFSRRVSNKALALVYQHCVFEYPLNTLVQAGITDITMVVGYRYAGDLLNVIGDGKEFGVKNLTYVYQKEARGISDAIYKARKSISGKCAVILGDNFFEDNITDYVNNFKENNLGCGLFVKKVNDPERYGVAELFSENNSFDKTKKYNFGLKVSNIIEKPKKPKTDLAVTGLYFYDETVFSKIEKLSLSNRGELEVTDLNMMYVKENKCEAYEVKGYWNDMGTFDSILDTSNFIRDNNFKIKHGFNAWK